MGVALSRAQRAEAGKRSSNTMSNCPIAAVHSMGLRQRTPALRIARNRSFVVASSLGKLPRVLTILRNERCRLSKGVRGVDHLPNLWREGEHRHDVLPGAPPGRRDRRIALGLAVLALVALIGLATSLPAGAQEVEDGTDSGATITSVTLTSDPGAGDRTYAIGDVVAATVTFSEAVTVEEANGSPTLALDIGDRPELADYTSGSGSASLVFRYTVEEDDEDTDGIAIAADALALNNARITAGGTDAALAHAALPVNSNHKVDGVRPSLERIEVSPGGFAVILDYDEALGGTEPLYSQFTVKVNGVEVALGDQSLAVTCNGTVFLTLAG